MTKVSDKVVMIEDPSSELLPKHIVFCCAGLPVLISLSLPPPAFSLDVVPHYPKIGADQAVENLEVVPFSSLQNTLEPGKTYRLWSKPTKSHDIGDILYGE